MTDTNSSNDLTAPASAHAQRIVIVGAGLAGLRTAEELRRNGYTGELVLIGEEDHLPYDRPPLSKQVLLGGGTTQPSNLSSSSTTKRSNCDEEPLRTRWTLPTALLP